MSSTVSSPTACSATSLVASWSAAQPVRRYLALSTAHLPRGVLDRLHAAGLPVTMLQDVHTTLVGVPELQDLPDVAAYSPDLAAVLRYADERGCDRVLFDPDADHISDLPAYNW